MAIIEVLLTNTFDDQRKAINLLAVETGDLSLLQTTIKTDVVSALNEVQTRTVDIGTLSNLTTGDKSNTVAAINEVDSHADTNTANITINTNELVTVNGKIDDRIPAAHDVRNSIGNAGSSIVLDTLTYDTFDLQCDFATLTITESNMPTGREITLYMYDADNTTITWPTGTRWSGGVEPTWSQNWDGVKLYKFASGVYFATLLGQSYL